jgi:arylsulfatase A-like enzyme
LKMASLKIKLTTLFCLLVVFGSAQTTKSKQTPINQQRPNVIFIYADDLGYGDLSSYGATEISTPNIDQLANQGIRFTNAHATSATCTPSRFALMTGVYPWRQQGTGVLTGDAALIIPIDRLTLPKVFKKAGYRTAIVGKWHLGLGEEVDKNWNAKIKPGPNDTGFDYSFIFPATADRVPTVFLENHVVIGQDSNDPIHVNYGEKIGNDPTGKENPELLKMKASPNHGHDNTIVNGIGRIGFMTGGYKARWTDEEISTTFLTKAREFIEENRSNPFFLYLPTTEPHVPRMPANMFKGKSKLGYRGDAILQLDWTVGEIVKQLEWLGIAENTIIVFSSDNGPVLDDGYQDEAVSKRNGHNQNGVLRGGKYSAFEAGTRVPFILHWPKQVKPAVSVALVSQIDFIASFANFFNQSIPKDEAMDSENVLPAFLGRSNIGRASLIKQGGALSILKEDGWKYIKPNYRSAYNPLVDIELGNSEEEQLYNLNSDLGEKENKAQQYPAKVKELVSQLEEIINKSSEIQ